MTQSELAPPPGYWESPPDMDLLRDPADIRQLRLRGTTDDDALLPPTLHGWLPFLWRRVLFPGRAEPRVRGSWLALLALVVISGVLLFPWMNFHLFEPDEGRYAQIPFEMWTSGEWVVPTLQGEPYLDKPPLFYWMVMMSYAIFGVHDWSARFVPALAVQATVLLTYVLGRRLVGNRAACWGALALLLAPGFIGTGRLLVLDGLLTLWVTLSLLASFLATQTPRLHRGWWLLAGVACGLGVLTKGPVAVLLAVPPLLAHRWLAGGVTHIGWRGWSLFAGIVLGLNAPWYLAVSISQTEFSGYFFWKHNILRFVQPFDHERPVWFYVPLVLIGLFPATLLLWPLGRWLGSSNPAAAERRCPTLGFLLLASGWCLFFFSMAGSKLPTYILPAVPCWCLALGVFLARTGWHQSHWVQGGAVATGLVVLAGNIWLTPAIAWQRSPMNTPPEVLAWCQDSELPVYTFPRNVDSMAFYAGRSDFTSYRGKELSVMLEELGKHPRAVALMAHRNSLGTLRHHLPPHLRIIEDRPMGLCDMAVVERVE